MLKTISRQGQGGLRKKLCFFREILGKKGGQEKNRVNYYPFGLTFNHYDDGSGNQTFKFNGVEQEGLLEEYEMAFRGYDPALGRFKQVDPLTGVIPGVSAYHFGFNNPIRFADPLGLMGEVPSSDRYGKSTIISDMSMTNKDPNSGYWKPLYSTTLYSDGYNFHDKNGNEELDDDENYTIRLEIKTKLVGFVWVEDWYTNNSQTNGGILAK